jgi:hypothetical protein
VRVRSCKALHIAGVDCTSGFSMTRLIKNYREGERGARGGRKIVVARKMWEVSDSRWERGA